MSFNLFVRKPKKSKYSLDDFARMQSELLMKSVDKLKGVESGMECSLNDMRHGDTITISGVFEPRTFWEFITMRPRKLKQYKAKSMTVAGVGLECH